MERDAVVGAGLVVVLELGLGDGHAERDVPQRRCLRRYASPRARLRRNIRWAVARALSSIDVYVIDQSTESPR